MQTTVGKLLLKEHLPPDMHAFIDSTDLDKGGNAKLFNLLAEKHPATYNKIVSELARLGFEVSTRMGSTVRLTDLRSPIDKKAKFAELEKQLAALRAQKLPQKEYERKANELYQTFVKNVTKDLVDIGVQKNQTLAKIIRSGSRGSPVQYMQTVFAPVLVQDNTGRPLIDFPLKKSFADGLNLPEYLAATFGSRQGEVAKKLAVADAGYFSKQMTRATMTLRIEEHDCGTDNGVEVDTSSKEHLGTYLAHPAGGFNKNNEVTPKMLNDLKNKGIAHIVVRSPITCQSSRRFHHNAICQLCAGKREKGLPSVGDFIGITASSTLGEPLAQGQLSLKHTSGSATGPNLASGFDLVKQLATIPQQFKDKAAIAEHDGKVEKIRPAPQGGHYIHIGKDEYYVPTGFGIKVKVGDTVEAGDVLSDGIINPGDIVRLKGVGEGRRYFAHAMKSAFDDSGMGGINHRNFEVLSKSMIDHVRVTSNDGLGDHLPGSIVSYQSVEKDYQPRADAAKVRIDAAYNKYLEQPVLHYTIGTRVTHKIIDKLRSRGIEQVLVSSYPPAFTPEMQRLDAIPEHEPDWMHQLYTANLERKILHAANTGAFSDLKGPSPVPGLAYGVGFGERSK
jgi:DNA-directed RNA polymerase subunit beta'